MEHSSDLIALEVLESLNEGCQVIGFGFTYLYVNQAVEAHGQRSRAELLGRTMSECYPGIETTEMYQELARCMRERAERRMENEFEFPDGSKGWFELKFIPVPQGVCVLSLDITERRDSDARLARTEAQLVQAQKMEAIGRLAGGVAHDFNNLLSVMLSYAELVSFDLPPGDPTREDIEEIRKAGLRAADLTRQLLTFSRRQVVEPKVLELNEVVRSAERLFGRVLGEDIELSCILSSKPSHVLADAGTLDQILMNLAVNARDAMPHGGRLTLETKPIFLDANYGSEHLDVEPGNYVMLAVSDTGHGMSKEIQDRVFEPFFTTKSKGKGTGLGLSTVFGIVRQCGGHIWLYSEPGVGTTFKIYLPCIDEAPDERPASSPSMLPRGNETILLVEDDEQVRAVANTVLTRGGYHVIEATDGLDALDKWRSHRAAVHLLLTDVVLPHLSGRDLAAQLSRERPELKVLFMSGYTDDTVSLHGILDSDASYLQKPLTPTLLKNKVREVLGTPPSSK